MDSSPKDASSVHEVVEKQDGSKSKSSHNDIETSQVPNQATTLRRPREMSQLTWICVVISLLTSMFLFALDNTVVADAQPKIIDTFGHVDLLPWVSVAYALGAIALNLFL